MSYFVAYPSTFNPQINPHLKRAESGYKFLNSDKRFSHAVSNAPREARESAGALELTERGRARNGKKTISTEHCEKLKFCDNKPHMRKVFRKTLNFPHMRERKASRRPSPRKRCEGERERTILQFAKLIVYISQSKIKNLPLFNVQQKHHLCN